MTTPAGEAAALIGDLGTQVYDQARHTVDSDEKARLYDVADILARASRNPTALLVALRHGAGCGCDGSCQATATDHRNYRIDASDPAVDIG